MRSEDTETGRIDIKTPFVSGSWTGKKTAELIAVLSLVLMFLGGYVLWEHKDEAKDIGERYVSALKLISRAMEENAVAQREFSCLISKDGPERRTAFVSGECRRQAEIGSRRP